MRILIFSDIHGDWKALKRLLEIPADRYVCAGDLVTWARGLEIAGPLLQPHSEKMYVLPGNHESASQISDFCKTFGFHSFHERSEKWDEVYVAALGYSSPTPFNTPGEYSEEEIRRRLEPFAALRPLVLICHAPPFQTELDRVRDGLHAGSRSVRQFIEEHQPAHFFCGHIHEAEGVTIKLGSTQATNVGKRGYLLDL
ncbi:MAG: metallophosphoesterase [Bryobacteraceae bacterium]